MTLTSIVTNTQERTRFFRFAAVGIVGAVVDFGTFNLLTTSAGLTAVVSFVSILGLLIRTPIIAILEPLFFRIFSSLAFLPIGFFTAEFLANNLALAIAVIVVMFWNFFINRYWTYNDIS
jgi:putative flippase GtrA